MSLLKYVKKISATNDGLPTPGGSLDGVLPPEAICDNFKSSYKEREDQILQQN